MAHNHNDRNTRRLRGGTFSYWLPLAIIVTASTIGIAAWIWSEREDDSSPQEPPDNTHPRFEKDFNHNDGLLSTESLHENAKTRDGTDTSPINHSTTQENQSYMARMSGALRRTPSPQQIFDGASRTIVEGITAAGVVVGTALGSIMEEDKNAYKDHRTWSEEADARATRSKSNGSSRPSQPLAEDKSGVSISPRPSSTKKITVAVVISADILTDNREEVDFQEHASILSYLPKNTDLSKTRLFVLIYAPYLKEHPMDTAYSQPMLPESHATNNGDEQSSSKYDMLNECPIPKSTSLSFNKIYSEALCLVEKQTMVLPFTTATGHTQLLRHLGADIIYLQDSLTGSNGEVITNLQTWLRHDVVVVVGDGDTCSGLADSESDADQSVAKDLWWKNNERVGKGRGAVIIEAFRIGDDWMKRVENRR